MKGSGSTTYVPNSVPQPLCAVESTPSVVEVSRELGTESFQFGTLGLYAVHGILTAASQCLTTRAQLYGSLHVILSHYIR